MAGKPSLAYQVGEFLRRCPLALLLADEAHSLERVARPHRDQPSGRRVGEGGSRDESLCGPSVEQFPRHATCDDELVGRQQVGGPGSHAPQGRPSAA